MPNHFDQLANNIQTLLDYDSVSRTAILGDIRTSFGDPKVAIVTAGTSDVPVAREATRTLLYHGVSSTEIHDVGVAGLWRLQRRVSELSDYPIIIAVAGMDAALPTVLGGLVPGLLIGVPSSTGYGVSRKGESALASMLVSCAPGIAVTNIDNGFGAACIALRGLRAAARVGMASG
jgi:NCAIR mutase (PurE)-related protein